MIKLYKFSDNYWIIIKNGKRAFSGNIIDVQTRLEGFGIDEVEVDLAIKWLVTSEMDNMCHFGVTGTAMFTSYEEIQCPVSAA